MSDFACMDDWDLQAVVRGCINEAPTTILRNPKSCFAPMSSAEDGVLSFPEISETATVLDELEKLYKPFHPVLNSVSSQIILASSISVPKELKEPEQKHSIKEPRRRKNQHKRVVHVTAAEGLCSDIWAWRKYGQKPIKGSPYPRSYYRCSSSKGCSARKLVERSPLEPGVFIVTYTSEVHNHTRPTRRNSLAGSTRSKFPTPKKKNKSSPYSSKVHSPTTPLMASIEDEFVQSASLKKEEQQMVQENEGNGIFNMRDIILDNELFPSLEDFDELASEPALDGYFLDQLQDSFPVPWFAD